MEDNDSLLNRVFRAVRWDADFYREIKDDTATNRQALAAVAIASLACGVGTGFSAAIVDGRLDFFGGLIIGTLVSSGGWIIWCLYSYWFSNIISGRIETKDTYEGLIHMGLLRTLAFSNTPRVFSFFYFIPIIGWFITLLAFMWAFTAGVTAVRETLGLSPGRAMVTCLAGWLPYTLLVFITVALTI